MQENRKQEPNKVEGHKFHNTTWNQANPSPILNFNQDKIGAMHRALKEKIFLLGDEYKDTNGLTADWAHFDFILGAYGKNFRRSFPDVLTLLKTFYAILWEYMGPVLKSYETLTKHFDAINEENEDIVRDFANLRLRVDVYDEFMDNHMPKDLRKQMKDYLAKRHAEIDAQVKNLVENKEARDKEAQRIKEEFLAQKKTPPIHGATLAPVHGVELTD